MARIEFVEGIQCKCCGEILLDKLQNAQITIYTPELCQNCGTHLITKHISTNGYMPTKNARSVVIKVTHKFIFDTYEVIREV